MVLKFSLPCSNDGQKKIMTVVCEQPQGGGKAILFPPNALKKGGGN